MSTLHWAAAPIAAMTSSLMGLAPSRVTGPAALMTRTIPNRSQMSVIRSCLRAVSDSSLLSIFWTFRVIVDAAPDIHGRIEQGTYRTTDSHRGPEDSSHRGLRALRPQNTAAEGA